MFWHLVLDEWHLTTLILIFLFDGYYNNYLRILNLHPIYIHYIHYITFFLSQTINVMEVWIAKYVILYDFILGKNMLSNTNLNNLRNSQVSSKIWQVNLF